MNEKMVSALTAIFVVVQSSGRYDDHSVTMVKSFADRTMADRFCSAKESEVRRLEGMQAAINGMMAAWDKANAVPDGDYSSTEYDIYHSKRSEELVKLELLTGYREACDASDLKWHDPDEVGYSVTEVPFGT